MRNLVFVLLSLGACLGADADDDRGQSDVGQTEQGIDSYNGTSLNGTSLNGASLNGTSLNGTSLNGTALSAISTVGPPLSGADVVGSTWNGTASNGAVVKLRIDSALQGTGTNADLWFYGVSYASATSGTLGTLIPTLTSGTSGTTWQPLCGVDITNVPVKAVAVAGVWGTSGTYAASTSSFTFACRAKTIAKCVELGYKTFKGYADQLASCVRLLRADYCGTGVSNTVNGTLLNLYDNVGVQLDTETWSPEAEWTPAGARCINSNDNVRYLLTGAAAPACAKKEMTATCGANFAKGAVLIDELPPNFQL